MIQDVRLNTSTEVNPNIKLFAQEVFNNDEIKEINHVMFLSFSKNLEDNQSAGLILSSIIPTSPKRPLYYVNFEVSHGPQMVTRYVVHYLCAYLNTLLDDLAKDIGGFKRFIPFGGILRKIKGKINPELYDKLDKYNKLFYVPAKHNFNPYDAKDHLFSLKDAIYCCYITMKLKDAIESMSISIKRKVD